MKQGTPLLVGAGGAAARLVREGDCVGHHRGLCLTKGVSGVIGGARFDITIISLFGVAGLALAAGNSLGVVLRRRTTPHRCHQTLY